MGQPTSTGTDPKGGDRNEELRAELKAAREAAQEAAAQARYWHEAAQRASAPAPEVPKPDDDPLGLRKIIGEVKPMPERDETLVDDLGERGSRALVERGFVSREDLARTVEFLMKNQRALAEQVAEAKIQATTRELGEHGQLFEDFPELKDQKNPVFARTTELVAELSGGNKELAASPKVIRHAARLARFEVSGSDGLKRILQQQGAVGGGVSRGENDDELDEQQLKMAARFGLTAEQYKKGIK